MKKKLIVATAVASLFAAGTGVRGNLYWDTNGSLAGSANGSGTWGTDPFWTNDSTGSSATGPYVSGSDVFISAGTNATGTNSISVSGTQTANSITFQNGTDTIGTPGSGGLILGAGGVVMNSGLDGNAVLSTNLASGILLTASQSWVNNSTAKGLTANAVISGGLSSGTLTFTLNSSTGGMSFGGSGIGGINDGTAGGNLALVKTGTGVVTLGGPNSYTGGTTINGGTLQFGSASTVPSTGSITINSSGVLSTSGPTGLNDAPSWLSSGKIATTSSGALAMNATNASTINLTAYPSLYLGATTSVTYTGALTPGSNGYLLGGGAGTLTVNVALNTQTSVNVGKSGTVVLSQANGYNGLTTVSSGILVITNNNALGTTAAGTTVFSGGVLALGNGITTPVGENISIAGTGPVNFGALSTNTGVTSATFSGAITLNDSAARIGARAGATLNVPGAIKGNGANQTLIISGESGTGTVLLSAPAGTDTFTGPTTFVRGVLKLGADNTLPTGTVLDLHTQGGTDSSTFDLNGFNQTVAGLQRSLTTSASTVTNSAASVKTLVINQASASTIDFGAPSATAGVITGNLALQKGGAGTLSLSAANSYVGGSTVTGGSLAASSDGALGAGNVSVQGSAVSLIITGTSNAISDAATLSLAGGGAAGTADFGYANLGASVNETVGSLVLGGVTEPPGVYGSSSSSAPLVGQFDEYFSGPGTVTVLPEPGAALLLTGAAGLLLARRRRY